MDKTVEFSIIIPCYNVPEKYLCRALDSIKRQSFSCYEIIVVDDGSNHEYHDVLKRTVPKYENAMLITAENGGVSRARNLGVAQSNGNFITFLDADDILTDCCFQEAYDAIMETGADIVYGGVKTTKDLSFIPNAIKKTAPEYALYHGEEINNLIPALGCLRRTMQFEDSYLSRGPIARFVKRSIFERAPFRENLRIGEDLCWNVELLPQCNMACVVKSQWYWYWQNPNSALHRFRPDMHLELKKAIKTIEPLFNMSDDIVYLTFHDYIVDSLTTVWTALLSYWKTADPKLIKGVEHTIYCEDPWTRVKEWRYFRLSSMRTKIMLLFYRFRVLFLYWRIVGKKCRE